MLELNKSKNNSGNKIYKKSKNNRMKESFTDQVFLIFIYIMLSLVLVIILYPLIYVVSASFSNPQAVISGKVWLLPVEPTLRGYQAVFKNHQLLSGFTNSFIYMIFGTLLNLVMTMLCAYPLAKKDLVGRNIITGLFVLTMYFSGGLVPSYMLIQKLGLLNTRGAMIIPTALSVWNVIIARTYLQNNIPDSLFEAAEMDGCTPIIFFIRIVLPLSAPILAVLTLYYGVGHWNTYFNAMIYLKDQKLFPLQLILRNILIMNQVDPTMVQDATVMQQKQGLIDLLKYAVIVVASVPVLAIYPFVQKHFVKGIMIGALKG
ncbi:MAG: carbohydrate ABC transporter permease [Epulopiscium sp.]|nr:carbohydrate ABC transporter permease [Candidatus Epulonipiscium sp.]